MRARGQKQRHAMQVLYLKDGEKEAIFDRDGTLVNGGDARFLGNELVEKIFQCSGLSMSDVMNMGCPEDVFQFLQLLGARYEDVHLWARLNEDWEARRELCGRKIWEEGCVKAIDGEDIE